MQITKTKAYSVGPQTFNSLEAAQTFAIGELLKEAVLPTTDGIIPIGPLSVALLKQKDALLAILSTKERKARVPKVKPGKKVKATVAALTPALAAMND